MTIIGRILLVLAVVMVFKSLLDLIVWKVLQPALPLLIQLGGQVRASRIIDPLLAHVTELKIAQAFAWAAVGVAAFHFLRLRRWARVAVLAVCWIGFAYVCAFGVVWTAAYSRIAAVGVVATSPAPPLPSSTRTLLLLGGLLVCVLLIAGLVAMIVSLRSADVRRAFAVRSR